MKYKSIKWEQSNVQPLENLMEDYKGWRVINMFHIQYYEFLIILEHE